MRSAFVIVLAALALYSTACERGADATVDETPRVDARTDLPREVPPPLLQDALDAGVTRNAEVDVLVAEVEASPDDAGLRRKLAHALRNVSRRQEALTHSIKAAELEPGDEQYQLDLALAYSAVARISEAEAIYLQLVDSPRLRPVVLHNLGNLSLRMERLDEALSYYRRALEDRPKYLLCRYHLGIALQQSGRLDEAYAEFHTVVGYPPPEDPSKEAARVDAVHRMASIDLARGRLERAAQLLAELLKFYPAHPNANYSYGRALRALGREEEARQAFERHLEVPRRSEGAIGFMNAPASQDASRGGETPLDFRDATERAGIRYLNVCGATPASEKGWISETTGAGAAWLDYDSDGLLDLYLVNGSTFDRGPGEGEPNQLYRGDGRGKFEDVTEAAGVGDRGWGQGVAVGDYDNDGDPDLYVTNYGPNVLYRNEGDGTFADVTTAARVGDERWASSAAFFDIEGDGDLDLYVANYLESRPGKVPARGETPMCAWKGIDVVCGPKGLLPYQDIVYRNDGDGRFTDVTRESGLWVQTPRYALGVVTADYDNDGDQDVYVANDSVQNSLWQNNGDGTFEDVGVLSMVGFDADGRAQSGMGTDFGDYDNDGWIDLVVTNFSHDLNTLYRNHEALYFTDESSAAGLSVTNMALSWGAGFYDFDLDADLDLFIANGHIFPEVDRHDVGTRFEQRNHLFVNRGDGTFVEVSQKSGPGMAVERSFRGAAFADYDEDGDVDVLLTALDAPALLLENDTAASGHFLKIRLVGTDSNRDGVGARVIVEAAGRKQMRQRKGGGSYLSYNDPRLHFGLGAAEVVDRIEVIWPSGKRDELRGVAVDRTLTITEGGHPGD